MTELKDRIEPFRGLLYNPDTKLDLAELIAPPYDLIGPALQQKLYDRSPYNVVRLELNREPDPYSAAAAMLREWISKDVCCRAARPAVYLYSQLFKVEGRSLRREGLIVRIRLEEFSHGRILPHERTFAAAKEDRLRLLTATRTNLSSIFGLYTGRYPELESLKARVLERPPMFRVTDDLGIENQLRPIESADEIHLIQRSLDSCRILIADGHHRYETALNYRRRMREPGGNPAGLRAYDYTMMTLTASEDPGLVILPTHRIVRELAPQATDDFEQRAETNFVIEKISDRATLKSRLKQAGAGTIAISLRGHSELMLLRLRRRESLSTAMPDRPAPVSELDVSVLHTMVLERLLGLAEAEVKKGGNIEYTIDADAALSSVAEGRAAAVFLLNPPTIGDVERVSDAGATMPEKSTYFYPKLATGLVMNPLDD